MGAQFSEMNFIREKKQEEFTEADHKTSAIIPDLSDLGFQYCFSFRRSAKKKNKKGCLH
jgi:hypothetical protein